MELPNIGKDTAKELRAVGILTVQQLKETGSKNAWLAIQKVDPDVCLHRLYGLEGAVQGLPKKQLTPETKAELKVFYCNNKKK
jgi:TfoX C-terminal domain.